MDDHCADVDAGRISRSNSLNMANIRLIRHEIRLGSTSARYGPHSRTASWSTRLV